MHSCLSSFCTLYSVVVDKMRIAIIGGNLDSLILSHILLDHDDFEIYIFEERAEIGFPVIGSGLLINHSKYFAYLKSWISNMTISPNLVNDKGMIFHRGWLEKDLALSLLSRGGNISVRTFTNIDSQNTISLKGAGGTEKIWNGDLIIDCSLIINHSLIGVFSNYEVKNGWKRSDDIWESWHSSSSYIPENSIEIISTNAKSFDTNTIDYSFQTAKDKFQSIVNSNDK